MKTKRIKAFLAFATLASILLFSPTIQKVNAQQDVDTTVQAKSGWQSSGISVSTGQTVSIQASGSWSHGYEGVCCGPNPYDANGYHDKYDSNAPLASARVGALIGRIGGRAPFFVGTGTNFTTTVSGALEFSLNDVAGTFSDNSGQLSVHVHVDGQPASSPVPVVVVTDCSQLLPKQLTVGSYARVNVNSVNLRSNPSLGSSVLASLPLNTPLKVVDGATCADNYWWWKVTGDLGEGWAAEGNPSIYYLVPADVASTQPLYLHAEGGPMSTGLIISAEVKVTQTSANQAFVDYVRLKADVVGTICYATVFPILKIYSQGKVVWMETDPSWGTPGSRPALEFGPSLTPQTKEEYIFSQDNPPVEVSRGNSYVYVGFNTVASFSGSFCKEDETDQGELQIYVLGLP